MTLLEAKEAAMKESRAQKGKMFFVTVNPEDGECDFTGYAKTKELVAHAYKNGSEVAVPLGMNEISEPAKGEANEPTKNKQSKTMATKAAPKKAAKKAAKKEPKEKKPRKWNPEPQFGFSAEAWKKLIAIGAKEGGLSFVQLMRKAVAAQYKVGE